MSHRTDGNPDAADLIENYRNSNKGYKTHPEEALPIFTDAELARKQFQMIHYVYSDIVTLKQSYGRVRNETIDLLKI